MSTINDLNDTVDLLATQVFEFCNMVLDSHSKQQDCQCDLCNQARLTREQWR